MKTNDYLMENDEEVIRLDFKTDPQVVEKQAIWAGLKPGMRVADIGCGSGKTTFRLHQIAQPNEESIGIDIGAQRIRFAKENYSHPTLKFECADARNSLESFGKFDFVWVRFLLEYYRENSFEIVKNISSLLNKGGILCLIDLDHNCLSHYGLSQRLESTVSSAMRLLETSANFDPYAGRKLYSYLYDLGFTEMNVDVAGHHVLFGELKDSDAFNWLKKAEVVSRKIGFEFEGYENGYEEFVEEYMKFLSDPRRFTYSPIICCRGIR
ncbi:class I SAM-dependent methyltransferase [Geobacter sp. DSM 9736]|uniref:class I SAM-dependent methyltransferase n=1 Tax=Geobacter sp. DSM 9736 TaxID=1277350 RepID=UPI000B503422|nr:class I SAM-dependent methyltransferase [Geobacter sp. DSM 9736]SNB47744.1 Methyltransferase domain-containing protein [Geobacter sp. DSM 9736]